VWCSCGHANLCGTCFEALFITVHTWMFLLDFHSLVVITQAATRNLWNQRWLLDSSTSGSHKHARMHALQSSNPRSLTKLFQT
jgi:hypothetical protein